MVRDVDSDSLISRCIRYDGAAWAELIETHRPYVLRVLVRTVGVEAASAAEDLEQELWGRLLANRCEALRPLVDADPSGVRAFLCRAALNLGRDHRRRLKVRQVVQSGPLEELVPNARDESDGIDLLYERHERRQQILEALEQVLAPPNAERDRLIFLAHYQDGLSASEISRMGVGLAPKGVESLLLRLVQRVRQLLQEKEDAA